jgi:TetR/AcrR family transcriptional regulator, cholesterol catabolism regulator
MPKGIPLTEEELNRRRHEIFASSVDLFIEKGFRETSMREISEAAGMGKSSLYDYFKTKDEILLWVVEDELTDLTTAAREIASQPILAIERLRQVMQFHLNFLISRKDFYLKLSFEVQRLAIQSQKRIQAKRHAYQDLIRQLIDEGIQEGSFRPVDTLLATRTLITILTPTVFTSRPTGTPEDMFNAAIDIILKGIQA